MKVVRRDTSGKVIITFEVKEADIRKEIEACGPTGGSVDIFSSNGKKIAEAVQPKGTSWYKYSCGQDFRVGPKYRVYTYEGPTFSYKDRCHGVYRREDGQYLYRRAGTREVVSFEYMMLWWCKHSSSTKEHPCSEKCPFFAARGKCATGGYYESHQREAENILASYGWVRAYDAMEALGIDLPSADID